MRQGTRLYFSANLAAQISALLRYVVLARLLGPTEFGIAATLILTAAFFESVSDTGADRFLIQDKDGDQPTMIGLVQCVQILRGVLIATGLALSAGLAAALFRQPELQVSLVALAAAPLIAAFAHLDLRRVQRHGDFRPESWSMLIAEPLALITTAIAAWIVKDHTAVIYGLVARSVAMVAVSHFTARRPYRLNWNLAHAKTFGTFAAPLALNGVLLFFGAQGDRVVVSSGLGVTVLGYYSAVLMLIYYPAAMAGRFLASLHLPELSRVKADPEKYDHMQRLLSTRALLVGAVMMLGYGALGPYLAPLIYGAGFAQPLQIFALLAALQCARFVRVWPTSISLSLGASSQILTTNFLRLLSLPVAVAAVATTQSIELVILTFVGGEFLALGAALVLLRRARVLRFWRETLRIAAFGAASVSGCAAAFALQHGWTGWAAAAAVITISLLGGLGYVDRASIGLDLERLRARLFRRRA